ncbi:MAG: hypothetical protein QOF76_1819 [Solirubrobacteraceae bacterium]|nr:hypothetical protein [Solirubrobacteraceae bacterium]
MRVAYVVSRFPVVTETFVVRELGAVDADPGVDIELFALFPPQQAFVHPSAERWVPRAHQPDPAAAVRGSLWWLARAPHRVAGVVGAIVAGYWRSPKRLVKSLVTLPVALGHARRMRALGVDHIHAHFANFPALAAWICARLLGVPYSVTAHAHDIFVDQSNLGRLVDDAAFFVGITEYNRAFLTARSSGRTPIEIVHCGVDTESLGYVERRLEPTGPVRAVCTASLQRQKGHLVLFDALAAPLPGLDRIQLRLIGSGPMEAALRERAAELGLGARVTFLGTLDEAGVAAELAAADLFVLPSVVAPDGQMEGLPVSLMEALAVGLPAIGTSLSGIPELLRRDATCLLATPGDADSLAAALASVLDDPDAAQRRAAAGRALIEDSFRIEVSGARLAELFKGAGPR